MLPILPRLRHFGGNTTVEEVLQSLQAEAKEDPQRYSQLSAVRYYLHYTLFRISGDWLGIVSQNGSNYHTLLDDIRHYRTADEQVALVTFNYDTLLERALQQTLDVPTNNVEDYIAHSVYKVFKLHGSVRWAHPIESQITRENRNFWDILGEIIQRAPKLEIGSEFVNVPNHLLSDIEHTHFYPAIAIPLQAKNKYECPDKHVEVLKTLLSTVNRMLIIGWSAMEAHFLQLIADGLPQNVRGWIVSGGSAGGVHVIERLKRAGINVNDFHASQEGFSSFILGREVGEFLRG